MGVRRAVVVGAAGVAAGLVARSIVTGRRGTGGGKRHPDGWKSVTILGDSAAFTAGGYPAPLQRVVDALEIRIEPAPGDRGFEVHARAREGADLRTETRDENPDEALRVALRDAKQVFEVGEILRSTPRPHGHRPRTLWGKAVDEAEDHAKGEGVL